MHADVLGDSWLEFVLDPAKLDSHLESLKTAKDTNPSGLVLIKTFAKQAEKPSSSVQSKREKLLNGLAAKVWYTLNISLDEIEKSVPAKYQRQLIAEMVLTFNTPVVNSTLHRWVLRTVTHGTDPDLVRYDPEHSMLFLRNWIATVKPTEETDLEIRNQYLSASFDLGEYLLYGGDFVSAETYLKRVKELHVSDSFSSGVINGDRLQGLLLATNLQNDMLETDNAELPWAYRWNLDSHSFQPQISCLNVVQHGIRGSLGLVPTWQQKLNLDNKLMADFFFKSCANAAASQRAGLTPAVVGKRMGALARRVCKIANSAQVWDSLLETAPQFEQDDAAARHTQAKEQFCRGKVREAINGSSGQDSTRYLQKVAQYARERQVLLKLDAAVSPEELIEKAKECYDMGEYSDAKRIYQSNQHPTFAVKCTYGILLVDIAIFLLQHTPTTHQYTHQLPQNQSTQEPALAILDQIQKCTALGVPDAFALQRIYLSGCRSALQKICAETKLKLEDPNQYNIEALTMCELGLGIADIMSTVNSFPEIQGQAQMVRALDPQLTRYFPGFLKDNYAVLCALLGKLRNPACPAILASISCGLMYSMQKTKSQAAGAPSTPLPLSTPNIDISLERYGLVAEITAMCKCKAISVTMDTQLLDMAQQLFIHLQTINPSHIWLAGIADTLFELSRFRDAIEFYLLAIATESTWFVGLKLGAHTYGMLGRLVSSLIALKATSAAVALLQLVPSGYAIAARILLLFLLLPFWTVHH